MTDIQLKTESALEEQIVKDPEWQLGAEWGSPRKAHPEGKVINHIKAVLTNIDKSTIPSNIKLTGTNRRRITITTL